MVYRRCLDCDRLLEAAPTNAILGLDSPDDKCPCLKTDQRVVR